MRIGVDVGGTFTDVVLIDDDAGRIHYTKVPTTPASPAGGVLAGIEQILAQAGATMDDLDHMVHGHGTTIGTNALIERKGARTGLVTTEGFRDVLEIARIERPDAGMYDINVDTPEPLVPRRLRVGVRERVGASGEVVVPLDEADARAKLRLLAAQGVEAIAVCTLFSFLHPAHEERIGQLAAEECPGVHVSLSSQIAPEFREFERSSTTVINAYLQPIVRRYLETLQDQLDRRYGRVEVRVMQASGGAITAELARHKAARTVNSGPAGGAVASCFFGGLAGDRRLVTVDMGGTSFDIGLVEDGRPRLTSEGSFEGYPVRIPQVDVRAIGAGGGSIAWIDAGGALNVGPQSAGADPGPACYGKGGERPTVTDANLVLGRIDPDYFLGGRMHLDRQRAVEAVRRHVAAPLGLELEAAAHGILRVVNANMVKGIAGCSIERGHDAREFTLVAFGGAGPLHAAELAGELEMRRVVLPPYPGALSAFGLVTSDVRDDYVATLARADPTPDELAAAYAPLQQQARRDLDAQRVPEAAREYEWSADLRYRGQSYELGVPVDQPPDAGAAIERFHALHQQVYEYSSRDEPVEWINVRLVGIGRVPAVRLPGLPAGGDDPACARKGRRPVYFGGGAGAVDCPLYERERLEAGNRVPGPALIEETSSTTLVPPGWTATVDPHGNLILELVR